MIFNDAKARCESDGASLPVPKSNPENNFIRKLSPGHIWLGIRNFGDHNEVTGQWNYLDGSDVSFTNWDLDSGYGSLAHKSKYAATISPFHDGSWSDLGFWNELGIDYGGYAVCIRNVVVPTIRGKMQIID